MFTEMQNGAIKRFAVFFIKSQAGFEDAGN
jgi:hypothetical protein